MLVSVVQYTAHVVGGEPQGYQGFVVVFRVWGVGGGFNYFLTNAAALCDGGNGAAGVIMFLE
jgi:hypothetical protein